MPNLDAVIFVPALAGSIIFGFCFALYLAHNYLCVLQGTGAGARHVPWASEPILDHFWKVFYLAWLVGLWLGPAWLLGRAYAGAAAPMWLKFAIPLGVFWLLYPVSQLSSLSASSVWVPLTPGVFDRLARKPLVVAGFYALSGLVVAWFGWAFYLVFRADGIERLVVGCPLFVLAVLMYARLLGRLAFALTYTRSMFDGKPKRKKPRPTDDEVRTSAGAGESVEDDGVGFVQPSELPALDSPDEGPLTGYDVRFADEPAPRARKRVVAEAVGEGDEPRPRRGRDEDDEDTAYGVGRPEVEPEERIPESVVKPSEAEMRLLSKDDAPKPPRVVWSGEVLAFLGQPETLGAVAMLSGMCFAVGGLVRIARAFNPAPEAG